MASLAFHLGHVQHVSEIEDVGVKMYAVEAIWVAEREGFEPSVPVTQYDRLTTPRQFANGVT